MFTIETEPDCTVVTTLDDSGIKEDVQVILASDEDKVYIVQRLEETERVHIIEASYQQLLDIFYSLDLPDGAYLQDNNKET